MHKVFGTSAIACNQSTQAPFGGATMIPATTPPAPPRRQEPTTTPYTGRYVHYYLGNNPKAVHVEVDGRWYGGKLRSWDQASDRSWSGVVTWGRVTGDLFQDRFRAERIREAS